jgi:hypothetical protein
MYVIVPARPQSERAGPADAAAADPCLYAKHYFMYEKILFVFFHM